MFIAKGLSPTVIELKDTVSPTVTPIHESTKSATVIVTPTLTPSLVPTGWINGRTVFWGLLIIVAIAATVYWLKNRHEKVAKKGTK